MFSYTVKDVDGKEEIWDGNYRICSVDKGHAHNAIWWITVRGFLGAEALPGFRWINEKVPSAEAEAQRMPSRPIEVTPRAAAWNLVRDEMAARDAERLR